MEHYYNNIQGWFDFQEFYKSIVEQLPMKAKIVEVGSWKGCSTAFLGVEIINSNKDIELVCVDIWEWYNDLKTIEDTIDIENVYEQFIKNIEPLRDKLKVTPIKNKSIEASKLFDNESLDFVFIDANHSYEEVSLDIEVWYPKVKENGVIAGHDFGSGWPGVVRAVEEKITEFKTTGSVWYKYKKG